MRLTLDFKDENEKKEFVNKGEYEFRKSLSDAVERCKNGNIKIITVTGPSCSGKTTASNRLIEELKSSNNSVRVVSIDNFFFNRQALSEAGEGLDLDSAKALDLDCFEEYMNDIYDGKSEVKEPVFVMTLGARTGYTTYNPSDYNVFLFEGIQVVYPEVYRHFEKFNCLHIFLCVSNDLEINGSYFDKYEIRFLRRLVRDCKFRGSEPDFVFSYWNTVRENEKKNIEPYVKEIEIKINSLMPYELCVIKPYAEKLIRRLQDDRYSQIADSLLKRLEKVPEIPSEYVPSDSVFREFIG